MLDLTFGEQVKIILSRKGMTIKELAETIEKRTGKKMSRQNLTQRLGRDNFQEQDMRMIAEILGCPFQLSILGDNISSEKSNNNIEENVQMDKADNAGSTEVPVQPQAETHERDITIGELVDIHEELDAMIAEEGVGEPEEYIGEVDAYEYDEEPQEEQMAGESEEIVKSFAEEYVESQSESVEELLQEIEDIESERKPQEEEKKSEEKEEEEQLHGWKAYLMRRKKKRTKEQEEPVEDMAENSEAIPEAISEEISAEESHEELHEEPYDEAEEEFAEESAEEQPVEEQYMEEQYTEEQYTEEYMDEEEDLEKGEINPYTGREYESNSVRMHPSRIGYVQVYDRSTHQWTDMTEWAFLGYQERKKVLLGKDYEPPIYLD
ncbi:hypothetical protein [Dorea sp. YH-dor228]|uniref:hypothetical protein n=1 Tax=Lachnospiraceae TaxID=186803 RepID=UPI0032428653